MDERYIAAIDLGSSRIYLAVARVEGNNTEVIYFDSLPSDGIRHSAIVNPRKAGDRIRALLDKAQEELGVTIRQIVTNYPRYSVRQEIATGMIERSDPESSITEEEVSCLKDISLEDYPLDDPAKEFIYGAMVQSFSTDDYRMVREDDVVGMISRELQGNFKIFIGNKKNVLNIDAACNVAQVAIARKFFSAEVEAKAVLTKAETENGVALVNIGSDVTSVSIFHNGILRYYDSIPFGGRSIVKDICNESGFSEKLAENLKLAYGACMPDKLQSLSEKILHINYDDGIPRQISVKYLSEVIDARQREIIEAILWHIENSGLADLLRNGVVLTGGGALLTNCANLFKEISGYTVRMGYARHLFTTSCASVGDADATTCIGMVLEARRDEGLNCAEMKPLEAEESEESVPETDAAPAEEVDAPVHKQLFSDEEMDKMAAEVEAEKKKKKERKKEEKAERERKATWFHKLAQKVGNAAQYADNAVGNLFDSTDTYPENETK